LGWKSEDGFSKRNHIKVGDKLVFNVQGLSMNTVVTSIRQVNWNKIQTNFQVVFPTGVLEDAPQFYVELTHVADAKASAKFQQEMVRKYANVSIIDLGQVISIVDDLLDKIGYIIRFMSGFSIITGIVVLIASVRISKYQRIQESVLLRTLGASRKQIFTITALEYIFLGALSALTGILIAITGSWLLAKYSLEIPFGAGLLPVAALFLIISLLTLVIGLVNSRGVLSRPPLEILRSV
jgi:putative ABC transport system permease protein